MRTRLFTLACDHVKGKTIYFLIQQADVTAHSGQYGGSRRIRISKVTAHKLLDFGSANRFGTAPNLASVTVVIP